MRTMGSHHSQSRRNGSRFPIIRKLYLTEPAIRRAASTQCNHSDCDAIIASRRFASAQHTIDSRRRHATARAKGLSSCDGFLAWPNAVSASEGKARGRPSIGHTACPEQRRHRPRERCSAARGNRRRRTQFVTVRCARDTPHTSRLEPIPRDMSRKKSPYRPKCARRVRCQRLLRPDPRWSVSTRGFSLWKGRRFRSQRSGPDFFPRVLLIVLHGVRLLVSGEVRAPCWLLETKTRRFVSLMKRSR